MFNYKKYNYLALIVCLSLLMSSCAEIENRNSIDNMQKVHGEDDVYNLRYNNDIPIKKNDYIVFSNTTTEPNDVNIDKEYSVNGPTLIQIHSDFKKILYSERDNWSFEEVNMESLSPEIEVTEEKENNKEIRDYKKGYLSNIVKDLQEKEDRPISIRQEIWINKDEKNIDDFILENISRELSNKYDSKLFRNSDFYEFKISDGENIYIDVTIKKYHIYDRNLEGIEEDEQPYFQQRNNRDCVVLETIKYIKK